MMYFDGSQKIPETGETINGYTLGKMLDNTKNSVVFVSKDPITNESVCVKFIKYTESNSERVDYELKIMRTLNSPFIIQCKDEFDYPPFKCVVMPLATSDLQVLCRNIQGHKLPEQAVKAVIQSALYALKYLHSNHICHRDIKPDNFLIVEEEDEGEVIRLADLGFAKEFKSGELCNEYLGTLEYAAPEVISGTPYDGSVDIWSLGVSMYVLLSGYPPFPTTPECTLRKCIQSGAFMFPANNWKGISNDAKDLIRHMIRVKPDERWTPEQCLKHQWFADHSTPMEVFKPIMAEMNSVYEEKQQILA